MAALKVLLDYHRFGYPTLHTFTVNIVTAGIYANTAEFATPPVTLANYQTQVNKFATAYDDYKTIGKSGKATFEIEKNNTILLLDQLADYVNALPNLTEDLIDLSGFHHNKTSKTASVIPGQVAIKSSKALGNGVMELNISVDAEAVGYMAIVIDATATLPVLTQNAFSLLIPGNTGVNTIVVVSTSHYITINALAIGNKYNVYVYAFNTVGCGPLSQPYMLISVNS